MENEADNRPSQSTEKEEPQSAEQRKGDEERMKEGAASFGKELSERLELYQKYGAVKSPSYGSKEQAKTPLESHPVGFRNNTNLFSIRSPIRSCCRLL